MTWIFPRFCSIPKTPPKKGGKKMCQVVEGHKDFLRLRQSFLQDGKAHKPAVAIHLQTFEANMLYTYLYVDIHITSYPMYRVRIPEIIALCWWLNPPILKNMRVRQIGLMKPQGHWGEKSKKCVSCHHLYNIMIICSILRKMQINTRIVQVQLIHMEKIHRIQGPKAPGNSCHKQILGFCTNDDSNLQLV